MKKWIILFVLIIAGAYFFFWQNSFDGDLGKLNALDQKYFDGLLPNADTAAQYKNELSAFKKEVTARGESTEKKALLELIEVKMSLIEYVGWNGKIEDAAKKVNFADIGCSDAGAENELYAAYSKSAELIESVSKKVDSFKAKYGKFHEKIAFLGKLEGTLPGFENYIYGGMATIEEECGWD